MIFILRQKKVLSFCLELRTELWFHNIRQLIPSLVSEDCLKLWNIDAVLGHIHYQVDEMLDVERLRIEVLQWEVGGQ